MTSVVMLRILAAYLVRPIQQELSIALRISKQIPPCNVLLKFGLDQAKSSCEFTPV